MYTLKGTLHKVGATQNVSDSFRKRDFVILDDSSQYPQHISLQVVQDKCDQLDQFKTGDRLTVSFNLRGREWTNPKDGEVRYFNTLDAWKIEADAGAPRQGDTSWAASGDEDLPY